MKKKLLFFLLCLASLHSAFAQSDTTAPVLNSINITPNPINAGETATLTVNVTDDDSGVDYIDIDIFDSNGEEVDYTYSYLNDIEDWTDLGDNNYTKEISISEWAADGEWYVESVYIRDTEYNSLNLYSSDEEIATFTVNSPNADTTAPVLNSISITPNPINAGETATITVNITDDVSGVNYIDIEINNEEGEEMFGSYYNDIEYWTSIGNNTYTREFSTSQWDVGGQWYVDYVNIRDAADNRTTLNSSDEEIATFTVNSDTPDTTAPVLNSISITPNPVNTGETITVTVNITDDVSGIDYIDIDIYNAEDNYITGLRGDISNWTNTNDDNYSKEFTISQWTTGGEWYVGAVYIRDNADNTVSLNSYNEEIATFTVNADTPDTTAPVLNSISISPDPVNAGETTTLIVNTTDDISGLAYIDIDIYDSSGEQLYYSSYSENDIEDWTDLGDNNYAKEVFIPEWAANGEWYVESVAIRDNANNGLYLYSSDNEIATFTVNSSNADTTAPVLNSINITPNPINAGETATVTLNITDDVSGLNYIDIDIYDSEENYVIGLYGNISSWNDLGNNTYSKEFSISEWAANGEWYVESVNLKDNANNNLYLYSYNNEIATFTVNSPNADTTTPVLNSINITPNPINAGETATVTLNITDDVSGLNYIDIGIYDSEENYAIGLYGNISSWNDLGNNTYSKEFSISEWAANGEWYVNSVSITDNANNNLYVYSSNQEIATFIVNSSNADTTAPVLNSIAITPNPIDAGETATITVNITDDVSGIDYISCNLYSPNGQQDIYLYNTIEEWTNLGNNTYSMEFKISEWAENGEWYIDSFTLRDNADNGLYLYRSDQEIATFMVNNANPDTTTPVLNSINITPNSIDAGETATITINTTDDISGINTITVDISSPSGEQDKYFYSNLEEWTDLGNNTYSYNFKISEWAENGEWFVDSFTIRDNADNRLYLYSSDQEIATFIVNNTNGDTTAPVLNSIAITPNPIDAGETATITVNITDDVSGIDYISCNLYSPNGQQDIYLYNTIEEWTNLGNNTYSMEFKISEWAENGEWYIDSFTLRDNADNGLYLYRSDQEIATFMVNNANPDTTTPVLNSINITPNSIDAGETATITINTTDDISGINTITFDISSPSGEQDNYISNNLEEWTDLGNNTYSYNFKISEWAENGEWYVNYLYISDNAENQLYLNSYNQEIATFTVNSSTPDITAPQLNAITITPNDINAGETFTVTIDATDDLSGLERVYVRIQSPDQAYSVNASGYITDWNNIGNNQYTKEVTISEWAVAGEWYVDYISISDNAGNRSYMYDQVFATFNVNNSNPADTTDPEFNSIAISPSTITDGGAITVTVNTTDDLSGVGRITVLLNSPDEEQYYVTKPSIEDWQNLGNNTYSTEIQISEFAISGEWNVSYIYIVDNAGNSLYNNNNISSENSTFTVNNTNQPDITAPQFNSVTITPNSVQSGDTVTITVDATDNLSGINTIYLSIISPLGGNENIYIESTITEWQSIGNNLYTMEVALPETATEGEWYVSYISLTDNVFNSNYTGIEEYGELATFTVTNDGLVGTVDEEFTKITLYPNPSTDGKFYISTTDNSVELMAVYNYLGQEVKAIEGNTVNLSNSSKGIYLLKVKKGNHTSIHKLIVK